MRLGRQALPPKLGFLTTCLCRSCWPPSQVLSQESHSLHSESSQSTAWLHSWISWSEPWQTLPPPSEGSSLRLRQRWPSWPQALHSAQALRAQSFESAVQWPALQTASSSRPPSHGAPPLAAVTLTARVRCLRPPRQLCVHSDQAPHELSSHGTGRPGVEQNSVSVSLPSHGLPPLTASWRIFLFLNFWLSGDSHSLQGSQVESSQSCDFWHSIGHSFVSTNAPEHASPPQALAVRTTRVRSQSWLQEGWLHSVHSPMSQFRGWHSLVQLLNSHAEESSCMPSHVMPPKPENKCSAGCSLWMARTRCRERVAGPHSALHSP
mmetsp:Transcript_28122/g.80665  ORF Transcript_28122/g.80665 Transcript_28122/m.80665 type:complete len:321 (-) Transcript_28122:2264-3226(-)